MQNKANFRKAQMNVKSFNTVYYENIANCKLGENKANTKPIQSQSKPIQSQSKPKQRQIKPIKCQNKPNQTQTNPIPLDPHFYPKNPNLPAKITRKTLFSLNHDNFSPNFANPHPNKSVKSGLNTFSGNFCTNRIESFFDSFIAPVDVIDPVDNSSSLSSQPGENQCR